MTQTLFLSALIAGPGTLMCHLRATPQRRPHAQLFRSFSPINQHSVYQMLLREHLEQVSHNRASHGLQELTSSGTRILYLLRS